MIAGVRFDSSQISNNASVAMVLNGLGQRMPPNIDAMLPADDQRRAKPEPTHDRRADVIEGNWVT